MTADLIDAATYADLCDAMGADFAAELAATFLDDAPNMIAALKQSAADGDADAFRRAAHSIKSNAEIFGAMALTEVARDLELSGLSEATAASIPTLEAVHADTAVALGALMDA